MISCTVSARKSNANKEETSYQSGFSFRNFLFLFLKYFRAQGGGHADAAVLGKIPRL